MARDVADAARLALSSNTDADGVSLRAPDWSNDGMPIHDDRETVRVGSGEDIEELGLEERLEVPQYDRFDEARVEQL